MLRSTLLPRILHPVAWWVWVLCLAVMATRTTDILLLAEIIAVLAVAVAARRIPVVTIPFRAFLFLGLIIITIRVVVYVLFGARAPGTQVFALPQLELPDWFAGVSLGGPSTLEGLIAAISGAMVIATLVICLGSGNLLADARRLLRCLPTALYSMGSVAAVSLTLVQQLGVTLRRIRAARRLRGDTRDRFALYRTVAVPALADAFDRSVALAAAMDARGYGREAFRPAWRRRMSLLLLVAGFVGLVLGGYQVLGGAGTWAAMGLAALGGVLAIASFTVGRARVKPTTYRPDRWRLPESAVVLAGLIPAVAYVVISISDPGALSPPANLDGLLETNILAAAVILIAVLAVPLSPPVPLGKETRMAAPSQGAPA